MNYEFGNISIATQIGMIISAIICFGVPIFLLIFCRKKSKAVLPSFFIGLLTFLVMAVLLESIFHQVMFRVVGLQVEKGTLGYALYGALAAASFEEIGRWISMKFIMKKKKLLDIPNSFLYGVGYGGCESIIVVGMTYVTYFISSMMINAGMGPQIIGAAPEAQQQLAFESLSQLWTSPAAFFYIGGLERIVGIALQITLSIIMFQAVKHYKFKYFAIAFLAHFLVDFLAAAIGTATIGSAILVEVILLVLTLVFAFVAFAITGKEKI